MANLTFSASDKQAYFIFENTEYPKKHFFLRYDNLKGSQSVAGVNFSIYNIYNKEPLLLSRGVEEIDGVTTMEGFLSLLTLLEVLESNTISSSEANADTSKRQALNTTFGELITGVREPSIAGQFQFGIEEGASLSEITGSGSIEIIESQLTISTGVNVNSKANIESEETVRYIPSHEIYCFFTAVFSAPKINSIQRAGLFDLGNGFFVSHEIDGKFYFSRRRNGIDFHQEIDLNDFILKNGYELIPTNGNIYRISYGYLGYAPIFLEVVKPKGGFALLAILEYPNKNKVTHTLQTFLPVRAEVENLENNSEIILKIGSFAAGITAGSEKDVTSRYFNYSNFTVYNIAQSTTVVVFRNRAEFNGIQNRVKSRLQLISGAVDLNKNARWKLYKNPVFTNIPTFDFINENNSIMEFSEDGIVDIAQSQEIFISWNTFKLNDFLEQVEKLKLDLPPNNTAAFVLSTEGTGEADLSIRWQELF